MNLAGALHELKELSGERLLERASQTLPPWVTVILTIAIAWQLAQLTWRVFPAPQPAELELGSAQPARGLAGSPQAASVDVSPVLGLFGELPPDAPAPDDVDPDEVDKTQLTNLTLYGTIAASVPDMGIAIIADQRKPAEVYHVDDPLPGRGRPRLHSVYPDKVIIDEGGGVLSSLELPRDSDASATTPAPRRTTSARRAASTRPAATRANIDAKRATQLTEIIRPQPVFSEGKQIGYRVYPGRKRQQFMQLGLQPGDLVTEINGTRLDDPRRGMEIFRSIMESSQVSVTVERKGEQPQVLVLSLDQLADS